MLHTIEVDYAIPEQGAAVMQMLNEYAMDPMGGGEPLSPFVRDNLLRELAHRPGVVTVLALDDDRPVGMIMSFEGFSTFACKPLLNLHDVVVTQSYRGKGVLRLMLNELEQIARRIGCCKLTMEILEGNRHAMAAYRAHGFAGFELDPAMGQAVFWQKKL
jgi:GNAT superfamily N-acetyltransferase